MSRRSLIVAGAGVLVAVLVAVQLLVPSLVGGEIEDRLTRGGGTAEVSVGSFPAPRLLFDDGDRITVRARGLRLDLEREGEVFSRLDGFDEVEVELGDSEVGPIQLSGFSLRRDGEEPYAVVASASTTLGDLSAAAVRSTELPGSDIAGALLDGAPGGSAQRIPIELDMELESENGRVRVVSGGGSVAGYPTGPLAELITRAIAVRI